MMFDDDDDATRIFFHHHHHYSLYVDFSFSSNFNNDAIRSDDWILCLVCYFFHFVAARQNEKHFPSPERIFCFKIFLFFFLSL